MDKRIPYMALALSGFATVVSVGSLVSVNKAASKFQEEKDRRLELEARIAKAELAIQDVESATMLELANRLEAICTALQLDCGTAAEPAAAEAPTVPDEFLARIGTPKTTGARIEVMVPGEVSAAILSNIEVLGGELEIEPAARNNRPDGFRLTALRAGGLGERLGFRTGDVIRAVNGMPFTSSEEVVAVFESLEDGRSASITFELSRDGKDMELVVEDPKKQPIIAPVP